MFRLTIIELLLFGLPVTTGIAAGKYIGRLANFCLMLAMFQVGLFILASANSGDLRPRLLIPIIFVWPPISAGQFVPPLLFVLVSIVTYRVRYSGLGTARG